MPISQDEILVIVPYPIFPIRNGGQKSIFNLYPFLSKYRSIHIIYPQSKPAFEPPKIPHIIYKDFFSYHSPLRFLNILSYLKVFLYLKRNKQISFIIIESPYMWFPIWFINLFVKRTLIIRNHNIESSRFMELKKWWWKIFFFYEKIALKSAFFLTFVTDKDRIYSHNIFRTPLKRSMVLPYCCTHSSYSYTANKKNKILLRKQYKFLTNEKILYFNGSTLKYLPVQKAIQRISTHIIPLLEKQGLKVKILISGYIPKDMQKVLHLFPPNILFCGFVDNIEMYYSGCDVFINPVIEGGGIKTKLVEALSLNANAVSFISGATGIDPQLCNGKLLLVQDGDMQDFAKNIIQALNIKTHINKDFFDFFYLGNAAKRLHAILDKI